MFTKSKPWRSKKYLDWIREQPCSYCAKPSDAAHHVIARGNFGGMGMKADDIAVIPVCNFCHHDLHSGDNDKLDRQFELILKSIINAARSGVLAKK